MESPVVTRAGPLFLDTSIQIARVVHSPRTKERLAARMAQHERTETSLVVRQEFKRRLLREAEYLLRLLERYGSFQEVSHHLLRLPGQALRKRNICAQMLLQVHGGDDAEQTQRLKLYLRSLLVLGLRRFDQQVDVLRKESGCGCGQVPITEKKAFRQYELGPTRCSSLRQGTCGVVAFLASRKEARDRLLAHLLSLSEGEKSPELKKAQKFLESLQTRLDRANQQNPCLEVGDLLIALESLEVPTFYTLNSTESQHLCRALGQTLIVRPVDPLKDDILCARETAQWPRFGRRTPPRDRENEDEST
jgi:hypothetical protein